MNVKVTQISINQPSTDVYSTISGPSVSVQRTPGLISIDLTIEMPSDNMRSFQSLEDFEELFNNHHDWATPSQIDEALREKFPERFI